MKSRKDSPVPAPENRIAEPRGSGVLLSPKTGTAAMLQRCVPGETVNSSEEQMLTRSLHKSYDHKKWH